MEVNIKITDSTKETEILKAVANLGIEIKRTGVRLTHIGIICDKLSYSLLAAIRETFQITLCDKTLPVEECQEEYIQMAQERVADFNEMKSQRERAFIEALKSRVYPDPVDHNYYPRYSKHSFKSVKERNSFFTRRRG